MQIKKTKKRKKKIEIIVDLNVNTINIDTYNKIVIGRCLYMDDK